MTLIDIFDDRYQHVGVRDKTAAHREALWRRTLLPGDQPNPYLTGERRHLFW